MNTIRDVNNANFLEDQNISDLNRFYVEVVGDTMTGDLIMGADKSVIFRNTDTGINSPSNRVLDSHARVNNILRGGKVSIISGDQSIIGQNNDINIFVLRSIFSFGGETKIKTPTGEKEIRELQAWESVLSFDLKTNSVVESEVLSLVSRTDTEYFLLNGFLRVTAKHPFYTERGWVKAENLQVGEMIFSLDGWQPLEKKELIKKEIKVFTLSVSSPNNYFAGDFLVHNKDEEIGYSINLTAGTPSGGNTPAGQVRVMLPAGSGTGSDGNLAIFTANGGMFEINDTDPSGIGVLPTIHISNGILSINNSIWFLDQTKTIDGCAYFPNWNYNGTSNTELGQVCMDSDNNKFLIKTNDVGMVLDFDAGETFIISQNGTERMTITNILTSIKTATTEVGKLIVNRVGSNIAPLIIQGSDFLGSPFKPGFAIWNNGETAESVWTYANRNNIFHFATSAPVNQGATGPFRIDASDGDFESDGNGTVAGVIFADGGIVDAGDLNFVGDGSGLAHGGIYFDGGLAAASTFDVITTNTGEANKVKITGFDFDTNANNVSFNSDSNNLVVNIAGDYWIAMNFSSSSSQSNDYEAVVYANGGSRDTQVHAHRTTSTAGRVANFGDSGIVSFNVGDTIEVWLVRNDGGAVTRTMTFEHADLSVFQLGG